MKVDCFPFHNETEMLLARVEFLYNYVDRFILVELDHTHSGQPKPYYSDRLHLPEKVLRVQVKSPYTHDAQSWQLERFQRDILTEFIPASSTFIHHSDVDEIPNPQVFSLTLDQPLHLQQDLYYYTVNHYVEHFWNLPFITPRLVQPSWMRHEPFRTIAPGGWHLSWFGTPQQRQNKLSNFAHRELDTPEALDRITRALPQDPWDRPIVFRRPDTYIPKSLYNCLVHHFDKNCIGEIG